MSGMKVFGYRIPTKQWIGGLVLWLIVGTVLWTTRNIPVFEDGAAGPRFMPIVLAVLLGGLSVFYWIESATKEAKDEAEDGDRAFGRPLAFVGVAVLLAVCWQSVGAVLTVFMCSVIELRFLERFSWLRTVVTALIISTVALFLFQIVLGVALPGGVLESLSYIRF